MGNSATLVVCITCLTGGAALQSGPALGTLAPSNAERESVGGNISAVDVGSDALEAPGSPVAVGLEDLFCWAVQGPNDAPTADLVQQRLTSCGGFAVFSNFSKPEHGVIKLYEGDMVAGRTPGGWTDNTNLFLDAWKFIAYSSWPLRFLWFVKMDFDTFFRPRFLPSALSKYNPAEPVALVQDGRLRGALEIVSASSFTHANSDMIWTRSTTDEMDPNLGGEDLWLSVVFEKAGFRKEEVNVASKCHSFLLTYFNMPTAFRDLTIDYPGHARNLPSSLLTKACALAEEDTDSPEGECVSREIVAMHPVKDRDAYLEFMSADMKCSAQAPA